MSEHERPRTTPRATEHDSETTDHSTNGTAQDATAYPRRRDVHHPVQDRPRRALRLPRSLRARRTVVPAALTVMALSTGMAAGMATAATGGHGTTTTTVSGTSATGGGGAHESTTTAFGKVTAASSADTSAAEKTLTRADSITTGAAEMTREQRKKIVALSDDVRALVAGSSSAAATTPASRSADRKALDGRDDAATAGSVDAGGDTARSGTDSSAAAAAAATAGTSGAIAPTALESAPDTVGSVGTAVAATATTDDRDGRRASRDGSRTDRDAADAAAPGEKDQLADKTASLKKLLDKAEKSTVEIEPAPPEPTIPEPTTNREPAPDKTATTQEEDASDSAAYLDEHANDTQGYGNGQVPESELCELSFAPGSMLRCDAATQLERLDEAYQADFGTHLEITDSYRSYASQVAVKASRGWLAAEPGTSNHGWAVAVDLGGGVEGFGSAQYVWMQQNAASYGWHQPDWAQAGGGKPEAWHWEYQAP